MPQRLVDVSIAGNTAGTLTNILGGVLVLQGGDNITLTQQGNTIIISGAAAGTAAGAFKGGMSNLGNTSGTTGTVASQMLIVGGNNVTISQSINGASATLTVIGPSAGGTVGNALRTVGSATGSGTDTSVFAADDHIHAGVGQFQISGNTSNTSNVVFGSLVLAGGNNVTLSQASAAGAATITISAANETQTVPPIATAVKQVASASSVGTITRFSPEDHAHSGVAQFQISGNTSNTSNVVFGSLVLAGGNNVTLSQGTAAGAATITISAANETKTVPPIATSVYQVASASSIGTATRFAPEDHAHSGVGQFQISGNTSNTSNVVFGSLVLAGGNNITLSQVSAAGAATITISGPNAAVGATLSYYEYMDIDFNQTQTLIANGSSHYVFPFILNNPISASYVRFPASWSLVSTSFATSAVPWSTTFSQANTLFCVVYSQNVGASSRSLKSVASGSAGWTYLVSATGANATNNWTVTQNITYPQEGSTSSGASNYASTLSTVNVSTTGLTNFTGLRYLDIPFANSLSQGNYWMAVMRSSTTGGGKGLDYKQSFVVASQLNAAIGNIGAATNNSLQFQLGLGSWSTNAIGTTASIGLASISSVASQLRPYFQMIRQA